MTIFDIHPQAPAAGDGLNPSLITNVVTEAIKYSFSNSGNHMFLSVRAGHSLTILQTRF